MTDLRDILEAKIALSPGAWARRSVRCTDDDLRLLVDVLAEQEPVTIGSRLPALVTGLVVDSSPEGWHDVEVTLTGTKP